MKGNARVRHDDARFTRSIGELRWRIWDMGCVVLRERGISFDTTDGNNESARRREATCFLQRILIRNAELGLLNLSLPVLLYQIRRKARARLSLRNRNFYGNANHGLLDQFFVRFTYTTLIFFDNR